MLPGDKGGGGRREEGGGMGDWQDNSGDYIGVFASGELLRTQERRCGPKAGQDLWPKGPRSAQKRPKVTWDATE